MYAHAQVSEWVSEWVSGWVGGWVSERCEWGGWVKVSGWVGEWVSGWVGEWVGEWVSEWVSGWVSECEWGEWVWVRRSVCVCVRVCVSEWVSEGVKVTGCEWVIEWLSEWCECVSGYEWFQWMSQWFKRSKSEWVSVNECEHSVPHLPRKSHQQCTLSHACHAKATEPQGTPGRTSDPLAVHLVPRLPRKSGGAPRDARAYIWPLGSARWCTPATQKKLSPKGRQGVHPTPWQCTLSHACHAKAAEPQGTPGRTSDPLAVHIVPRLPRKSGGAPRDARAYIQPLGSARWCTPATQKRRSPKGRQSVHLTPWQCTLMYACHAKAAEPQGTPGRTSDPLAVHIVPRLPRKRGGAPRDARAYIRPLGSAHCPTPATQKRRSRKGRQGVHQIPWQCRLSHACHAKEAEPQGTPGRTSDPLAVHIVPRLPRKSGGAPRDARAYIRPLGSAHCPTPATQKRRSPKGRQGVHPTPWQCTLSHACHAKAAEPQGTPGRTSNPLAVHIVPRLPRKMHIGPRLPREWVSEWVCVCVWVSECEWEWEWECECECEWEWEWEWEWVSERASECVCVWVRRRTGGRGGGYRTKNKNPTRQCGEKSLVHNVHLDDPWVWA